MNQEPLDSVPIWLLFVLILSIAGFSLEAGYRYGLRRHRRSADEQVTPVGAIVGSILALFAFLLAFTFGMAANRFDDRRQAVLNEANAIGTTYLRTRLLPEPQRGTSARFLREYADVRIQGVQTRHVPESVKRSEELHELLWADAVQAAEKQPGPITGLYIQSLNDTIDMHEVRLQAGLRSRIPVSIWVCLLALSVLSMASVGYQAGLSATRRSPAMVALALSFTCVLYLIADLDRGQDGFLLVSQDAMVDVQKSMRVEPK